MHILRVDQIKKTIVGTLVLLLFTCTCFSTTRSNYNFYFIEDLSNNTLFVGGNGSGNYTKIQDAINNASEKDTIFIYSISSPYCENVLVDKTISLTGENKNTTILDGMYGESVIRITADNVSIENFTIRNSGGYVGNAGVMVDSENVLIRNCMFYRTKTGIYLNESDDNKIFNCTFHTNGEGVFLKNSSRNTILDSVFCHNALGIHLQNSLCNMIDKSYIYTNGVGIYLNVSSHIEITRCAISENNQDQGGIFLLGCTDINTTNCNIFHNGYGMRITNSSKIKITHCTLFRNMFIAIELDDHSTDVIVSHSKIINNLRTGISVLDDCMCTVVDNSIYGSELYGVFSKSKSSICDARHNWWGRRSGPSIFDLGFKDRITINPGHMYYFPWRKRPLDDIGSDWEINDVFTKIEIPSTVHPLIKIPGNDTDNDGCPDWWEEKYGYNPLYWDDHAHLDPDNDGLNNVEECYTDQWGSNPFHKDIFLEVDWMQSPDSPSNKPSNALLDEVKNVFTQHEITLHVDTGELGGGEEIPYVSNFSYAQLRDLYWNYFLHNDLNNPRKGVFHYCIICDYTKDLLPGFGFFGWDQLDAFDISVQMIQKNFPNIPRGRVIVGTIIHELGHTIGLLIDNYGGIDNVGSLQPHTRQGFQYRNYQSCMNYRYVCNILNYSDGSHGQGDYNDWKNLDFYFFKRTKFELSTIH